MKEKLITEVYDGVEGLGASVREITTVQPAEREVVVVTSNETENKEPKEDGSKA